jgi:hypothetical protein
VAYIAQALATFEQVGPQHRQEIAVEIALKGQGGLAATIKGGASSFLPRMLICDPI